MSALGGEITAGSGHCKTHLPLQRDFPRLFDQIDPKAAHRPRRGTAPALRPVKRTGRCVAFMGPELHPRIALVAGESHAGLQHQGPKPLPARLGGQQEQPQLRGSVVEPHAKDAAKARAPGHRHPAAFATRVPMRLEIPQDRRHQGCEGGVEPFDIGIVAAMQVDQPVKVAGAIVPQGYTVRHAVILPRHDLAKQAPRRYGPCPDPQSAGDLSWASTQNATSKPTFRSARPTWAWCVSSFRPTASTSRWIFPPRKPTRSPRKSS